MVAALTEMVLKKSSRTRAALATGVIIAMAWKLIIFIRTVVEGGKRYMRLSKIFVLNLEGDSFTLRSWLREVRTLGDCGR